MSMFSIASLFEHAQPDFQYINAAGDNASYNGAGVDMQGYAGVAFFAIVASGEVGTNTLKVQQDTDSGFGTAADLKDTSVTITTGVSTTGFGFVDVRNPQERYVRPVLTVANFTTPRAVAVFSLRYGKSLGPETNTDGEFYDSPVEGTA